MIVVVVLVLFGGSQIPKLARSLGQAQKEFKDGLQEGAESLRCGGEGLTGLLHQPHKLQRSSRHGEAWSM